MESLLRFALVLCCTVAAPCALATAQLNVWHMLQEMDGDFVTLAAAFSRAHPDIRVKVHVLPNEELKAAAIRAANQQVAPDVIIISSDNVAYADLMQLSVLPADLLDDNLPANLRNALQFNQKNYSVPLFRGNHLLMLYNKALVKTPATEWQQLFNQHTDFTRQGVKTLALNYQEPYWFALFASLFDAELIKDNRVALDTPAMHNALRFYQQLVDTGVAQAQCGYHCVSEDFYQGKYAYAINGSWALAVAKQRLGDNLGIALFPQLQQRQVKPLASYIVMIFPNQSLSGKKAQQIRQLVGFFRQPANLQSLSDKHYFLPYYQLQHTAVEHKDPLYLQVLAQSQLSQLMPVSAAMVSVWNGMQKGMRLHQNNTLDAEAAAAFMQKVAQRDQQLLQGGL